MLKVTDKAKQEIKRLLRSKTDDPNDCVRISLSVGGERLFMSIDKQKNGDKIVKDETGKNILLVNSDLSPSLEGKIFDFQEGNKGGIYTLSPVPRSDV